MGGREVGQEVAQCRGVGVGLSATSFWFSGFNLGAFSEPMLQRLRQVSFANHGISPRDPDSAVVSITRSGRCLCGSLYHTTQLFSCTTDGGPTRQLAQRHGAFA